jgi:hypothetical protein
MTLVGDPKASRWLVDNEAYHAANDIIGSSMIREAYASLQKYEALYVTGTMEGGTSDAKEFGSAFHMRLLEPEKFKTLYVPLPKFGPNGKPFHKGHHKAFWNEFQAKHLGKEFLKPEQFDQIDGMVKAIFENPACAEIMNLSGHSEYCCKVIEPMTGLWIKAAFDWVVFCEDIVVNIKSAADPLLGEDFRSFNRQVESLGYHVQAAVYQTVYRELFGTVPEYKFIAVRSAEPFEAELYTLGKRSSIVGKEIMTVALDRIKTAAELTTPSQSAFRSPTWGKDTTIDIRDWTLKQFGQG